MGDRHSVFHDVHCHAFTLSHAGLLSFLNRFFLSNALGFDDFLKLRTWKIIVRFGRCGRSPLRCMWTLLILALTVAAVALGAHFIRIRFFPSARASPADWAGDLFLVAAFVGFLFLAMAICFWLVKKKIRARLKKTVNLLSVIENDLGRQLLLIEFDILNQTRRIAPLVARITARPDDKAECEAVRNEWRAIEKRGFELNKAPYRKFLLTPLMMDFNFKGFAGIREIHYDLPPRKPVIDQVVDLQFGIRDYHHRSPFQILQILPFLGLNTQNYKPGVFARIMLQRFPPPSGPGSGLSDKVTYLKKRQILALLRPLKKSEKSELLSLALAERDRIQLRILFDTFEESGYAEKNNLPKMLDKYFRYYRRDYGLLSGAFRRMVKLQKSATLRPESIQNIQSGFFCGIKVYPPLGFDPWPDPGEARELARSKDPALIAAKKSELEEERRKAEFLYAYCEEYGIPITTHCSDSGFMVEEKERALILASPRRWRPILEEYRNLRMNFAHWGRKRRRGDREWVDTIIEYMGRYGFVYADFSYRGVDRKFYRALARIREIGRIRIGDKIESRILFGTDFLINLIDIDSYRDYLNLFFRNVDPADVRRFCVDNPHRFLFG